MFSRSPKTCLCTFFLNFIFWLAMNGYESVQVSSMLLTGIVYLLQYTPKHFNRSFLWDARGIFSFSLKIGVWGLELQFYAVETSGSRQSRKSLILWCFLSMGWASSDTPFQFILPSMVSRKKLKSKGPQVTSWSITFQTFHNILAFRSACLAQIKSLRVA